jgi:hypothetical protein
MFKKLRLFLGADVFTAKREAWHNSGFRLGYVQ